MVRPIKEGKCCECKKVRDLYARGLCTTCYARDLRTKRKIAQGKDPKVDGRRGPRGQVFTGSEELDKLIALTNKVVQGYMRMKMENVRVHTRNEYLKRKFIVDSHKAWLKKVRSVNVQMVRVVKAEAQEAPDPRADDQGGIRELRLGVEG